MGTIEGVTDEVNISECYKDGFVSLAQFSVPVIQRRTSRDRWRDTFVATQSDSNKLCGEVFWLFVVLKSIDKSVQIAKEKRCKLFGLTVNIKVNFQMQMSKLQQIKIAPPSKSVECYRKSFWYKSQYKSSIFVLLILFIFSLSNPHCHLC